VGLPSVDFSRRKDGVDNDVEAGQQRRGKMFADCELSMLCVFFARERIHFNRMYLRIDDPVILHARVLDKLCFDDFAPRLRYEQHMGLDGPCDARQANLDWSGIADAERLSHNAVAGG
jgi:hypothetical protein